MSKISSLVETSWLSDNIDRGDIYVLDCSWHLPNAGRNGRQEYGREHITGALFFDIDDVCDSSSPFPHMMPDEETFGAKVSALGVPNSAHIIVYDTHGLFSAARVWWMFRAFGHENISILNGGLRKWLAEGLPVTSNIEAPAPAEPFTALLNQDKIVSYSDLPAFFDNEEVLILDARSQGRFDGIDPEPRPELSSGHMPGSTCLPFAKLLDEDGSVRPVDEVKDIFKAAGLKNQKLIVTSCGSGVTAAILTFGLHLVGYENTKLYDGSWSEYANIKTSVIV